MRFGPTLPALTAAAALASIAPSAGVAPLGTVMNESMSVGGLQRSYRLYVPARLQQPAPVVLVFHGGLGTGAKVAGQTGFDAEAERRGFLAVYPNGIARTWNGGLCCGLTNRFELDDVGFVKTLLDRLERLFVVDRGRVFATGISNGGLFSYVLACRLSSRVAAVAPVAATLESPCSPRRPVSILHVHGLDDQNIPFVGGDGSRGVTDVVWPPVERGIERWRELDGCPLGGLSHAKGAVTTAQWSPCRAGTAVRLVTIAGVGHVWPKAPYDATREIWRFFAAHPRR